MCSSIVLSGPKGLSHVHPARFRPQTIAEFDVPGICLIRLKHIRSKLVPASLGLSRKQYLRTHDSRGGCNLLYADSDGDELRCTMLDNSVCRNESKNACFDRGKKQSCFELT